MPYLPNLVNKLSIASFDPAADEVRDIRIGGDVIDTIFLTISLDAVTDLPTLLQYMEVLNRVSVLDNGNPVKEYINTGDLLVSAMIRTRHTTLVNNHENTDPSNAFLTIPICFGRYPYDPDFGYPPTRDEDLVISLDIDVADTNVDNPQIGVDVLYKKNFSTKGWVKETTKTITGTATGEFDISVPKEGKLIGITFFGTTVPENGADTATLDWVRYVEDNDAVWYNQLFWETMQSMLQHRIGASSLFYGHFHQENAAAMYTQNADTAGAENDVNPVRQYGYMDFDPRDDLTLWRDLDKLSQAGLRINYGDTSAARMVTAAVLPP